MGQAKCRGTKEERRHAALQVDQFRPADEGGPAWRIRRNLAERFLVGMGHVAKVKNLSDAVTQPYGVLLQHMWECEYRGACHSTSAILFVLLSELGAKPRLCIGEVRARTPYFDHSWIELDGNIFDIAVSLPDFSGAVVSGPVFASVDLYCGDDTELEFGISNGEGLGDAARIPFENTLEGYAEAQMREADAGPNIWELTVYLGSHVGLELSVPELINKYGDVKREYRRDGDSDTAS